MRDLFWKSLPLIERLLVVLRWCEGRIIVLGGSGHWQAACALLNALTPVQYGNFNCVYWVKKIIKGGYMIWKGAY